MQAAFIPSADLHDTSYFMSRYIWNLEEENAANGGSDCDDMTDTGSGSRSSSSYLQDEDVSFYWNDLRDHLWLQWRFNIVLFREMNVEI